MKRLDIIVIRSRSKSMKKKFILGLFILITLFTITGCGNSTEPGKQQG